MPFVSLHELFPEVASRETRVLTVKPGAGVPLPPGEYGFVEMFCDEPGCDCRRAFFTVLSLPAGKTEAIISWGWEDAAFYRRWLSFDDPQMVRHLQGPVLELSSPITANASVLLEFFANVLLADPVYVERVKKHYTLFRSAIDSGKMPQRIRAGEAESMAERGSEADEDAESDSRTTVSGRSKRDWGSFTRTRQQSDASQKVGRNDPCPCGSGKKFKKCCMTQQGEPAA